MYVLVGFQNASKVPIEFSGNADMHLFFQCVGYEDRKSASRIACMDREQEEMLSGLEPGECVVYLPKSKWKHPIYGKSKEMEILEVSEQEISNNSKTYLRQFKWETLPERDITEQNVGDKEKKFLIDVCTEAYQYQGLTQRFERSGIRSAPTQQKVLRELIGKGFIEIAEIQLNERGRKTKLTQASVEAFSILGMKPWKKGPGLLATRAATHLMSEKLRELEWKVVHEGKLEGKAVDLLCTKEGRAVAIEIAGNPAHEGFNLVSNLKCEALEMHVVIALDKKILKRVNEKISVHLRLEDSERVQTMTLAFALSKKWRI